MPTTLELATSAAEALAAKDDKAFAAVLAADVVLEAPMPIGKKNGAEKAAKALVRVTKLGVKVDPPEEIGGVVRSSVKSPAGAMVLTYEGDDTALTRLVVGAP